MSEANEVERVVISQSELAELERTRLLIHEVAGRMPSNDLSKLQLFNATETIWRVVNRNIMSEYREATAADIVEFATVYMRGDDEKMHEKIIDLVIKPSSLWKAFCADDGCRYGLEDCYVKEAKHTPLKRFYIDERAGCIAVRDREKDSEWEQGLHPDMEGVIAFWSGHKVVDTSNMTQWEISDWQKLKAKNLCDQLNK